MKYNKKNTLLSLVMTATMFFYACSPASPKLIAEPTATYEKNDIKGDSVSATPVVDILFVVDNSASMSSHQKNLANNVDIFLTAFAKMSVDYHIGVISTDMTIQMGELLEGCLDVYASGNCTKKNGYKYVTNNTPNALNILKQNILQGTNGSGIEAVFDPVLKSISPNFIKAGGVNAGFLRDNAYFAVIYITDAEDQSNLSNSRDLYDSLVTFKQMRRKVLSYGILIPAGVAGCPRDDFDEPVKIERFLGLTINAGNNEMSLCDAQFGQKLAAFTKDIAKYLTGIIKLNHAPIVSTIKVFFGTQEIFPGVKNGWYYDPKENSVIIGDDVVMDDKQPEGTTVKVIFDSTFFPEEKP